MKTLHSLCFASPVQIGITATLECENLPHQVELFNCYFQNTVNIPV